MQRICLLMDVRINEVINGMEWLQKSDAEGVGIGEPIKYEPSDRKEFRDYVCVNCGYSCSGEETFEEMQHHIGKMNPFIHPFGEVIGTQNTPQQIELMPDPFQNISQH